MIIYKSDLVQAEIWDSMGSPEPVIHIRGNSFSCWSGGAVTLKLDDVEKIIPALQAAVNLRVKP